MEGSKRPFSNNDAIMESQNFSQRRKARKGNSLILKDNLLVFLASSGENILFWGLSLILKFMNAEYFNFCDEKGLSGVYVIKRPNHYGPCIGLLF